MHVISKQPFSEAVKKYPNDRQSIMDTYNVLRRGSFSSPFELRTVFPSLDNFKHKKRWWVIDMGGNNLRLIAAIQFVHQRVYVKHIVTHAEYDRLNSRYLKGEL
ncbi:cytoplasmic protein [Nitrosococcus oceani]|nr:cytoplasmic protein [Nitrosococcus oceani]